ncbi:hypothetical protein JD76_05967 [Micromonospora endolithica]|nr:hypothetical protein JD76_05967 [Micromonospora endolithica]
MQSDSQRFMRIARPDGSYVRLVDDQNGLTYELGRASPSFILYLIMEARATGAHGWYRSFQISPMALDRMMRGKLDGLAAFRTALRSWSLRITSTKPRSEASWKPLADSFFFHLGFNLDLAIMPQSGIERVVEPSKILNMRRSGTSDLDPPRRFYINDLVHHYQLGVAADSAMLKYLSYYHVAEHWFENIFQDDLVEQVKGMITSPDFSYRRKPDIKALIKKVSKAIQVRDEELIINEQIALRLTLERYVSLPRLIDDLQQFDPGLLNAYKQSPVGFSGGDAVDLRHPSQAEVIAALSRRIYKTRNSLVHSKEGAKGRFIPFQHDAELSTEVPLMRFVAEQIILSTSRIMP